MTIFQLGEIQQGFVYNESNGLIHYRYALILAIPSPNQTGAWNDAYISFGCSFGDVRLRVFLHNGTTWATVKNWDIIDANGRLAEKLPPGTQKVSVGRVKKSANDLLDDNPVGWLLEYM